MSIIWDVLSSYISVVFKFLVIVFACKLVIRRYNKTLESGNLLKLDSKQLCNGR